MREIGRTIGFANIVIIIISIRTNLIVQYSLSSTSKHHSVRKQGSERTEREKALSRLRSRPQPGARTLRILQENSIDFIMGAGEEASLYLPWS